MKFTQNCRSKLTFPWLRPRGGVPLRFQRMTQPDTGPQALTIIPGTEQSLALRVDEQIHQEAREYLRAGLQGAANSNRAFLTDLKQYRAWCQQNGYQSAPLSPVALVEYVTFLGRTRSFFTIQRHLASIAKLHRQHRVDSPTTDEQFKVFGCNYQSGPDIK